MIGGNVLGKLQIKSTTKNAIGERIADWNTVNELTGFIDLSNGDSKYRNYYAKVEESTHVFICDYVELDKKVKSNNSRMIIDGDIYDVKLIDDPMKLHEQWEIYLSYTGGNDE